MVTSGKFQTDTLSQVPHHLRALITSNERQKQKRRTGRIDLIPSVATRAGGVVASGPVGQKRRTDWPNTVRRNPFASLNKKIPFPYVWRHGKSWKIHEKSWTPPRKVVEILRDG